MKKKEKKNISHIFLILTMATFFIFLIFMPWQIAFAAIVAPITHTLTDPPAANVGSAESAPDSGPTIISARVEPSKVKPGDVMNVTAEVEDAHGVKSVTADMGGIETIELGLVGGSVYQGTWEKDWLVHDTETRDYVTTITATNVLGKSSQKTVEWSDPSWLSGWLYRMKLTIDQTDVDADLADFPVLVKISASSGITGANVANIFTVIGDNKLKIAATTSDGTTQCYVEVEKWDSASSQAWLWVKAPSISGTTDTDLYLYYDNLHADNTAYVGVPESTPGTNVWNANFKAVYHLGEGSGYPKDSTANNKDMNSVYGTPDYNQTGKIGYAINFQPNEYFRLSSADILALPTEVTFEAWETIDTFPGSTYQRDAFYHGRNGECKLTAKDTSTLVFTCCQTSGWKDSAKTGYSTGVWYYHAGTYKQNSFTRLYVDGTQQATRVTDNVALASPNTNFRPTIGQYGYPTAGSEYWDGLIDEIRISAVERPAAWIKASYESGRDNLITWGSEEVCTDCSATLNPVADSLVFQYYPNDNFGSSNLNVYSRIGYNERGFLKFNLSGLPAGATITNAKLRLYCSAVQNMLAGVTDNQCTHVSDDTWTETGITWNNQPAYGTVDDTKVPAVGWVEWTVTGWVQNELAGDKSVSVCLKTVQESYDNSYRGPTYNSKEGTNKPELVVNYTLCKANGNSCFAGSGCCSENCKSDYDGNGAWCCDSNQCAHDGTCYNSGTKQCYGGIVENCNAGSWEISENCGSYSGVYLDSATNHPQCSGYNYTSYSSANQTRNYYCSGGACDCDVTYDSYITQVSVNGVVDGHATVSDTENIIVITKINNTGKLDQGWWFVGVEFWNVSDYSDPYGTRSQRVDTYYNGKSGAHGTLQGVSGADCSSSIDNVTFNSTNNITITCWVPASYFGITTGNQRIMFWVHERDTGQDAGNDGCGSNGCPQTQGGCPDGQCKGGSWWTDALSVEEPAKVKVSIGLSLCSDYANEGNCKLNTDCAWCPLGGGRCKDKTGVVCINNVPNCTEPPLCYGSPGICASDCSKCDYTKNCGGIPLCEIGSAIWCDDCSFCGDGHCECGETSGTCLDDCTKVNESFTIYPGWNLISIPFCAVIEIEPEKDLCGIFSKYFYYFDSTARNWKSLDWKGLEGGKGYWVFSEKNVACEANITGRGSLSVNNIPGLKRGYNAVGAPSGSNSIGSILGTCNDNIITVDDNYALYWNASAQKWRTTDTLEAGKGYWIRVNESCELGATS